MPEIKVYDMKAKEVGSLALNDEFFTVPYNESVIHQVIVAENANARQGTKSALTRSEVRGHAKKPYRQKHTGNARHGDTKAPLYTGGGVAFAPKPRDFSKKVNKQVKYLAFASALTQKLAQNEIFVIKEIKSTGKTKEMADMMKAFGFKNKTIVVTADKDETLMRACANIPNLEISTSELLCTGEVVANKNIVFSEDAIKKIEEVR